ncbi:MAG: stage II sporulation protein M, partial [Fimbriimonas ginsengisoli]|nr:stage II sporulation protein M [Fimbriimonas ginsengisoli]
NTFGKALSQAMLTAVQTVRRRKAFIFASAALFFGTALLSAPLAEARPDIGDRVLPKFLSDQWTKGQFPDRGAGQSMMMWSFYASNNPRVALITGAVAAGTFGLGTVTILSENGMLLGVLAARMADVGKLGYLFASILPHGVPELSGIIVSGAAGLALGWALVCPGRRRRGLALRDAGADAIVLLSTSAVLMLIAAPIEGFFSFNQGIPSSVKAAVAVLEIVLWTAFWVGYGNRVQPVS